MAEQQIHTNYSVADIERYLQGRMNAKEMHEMEKAALQDPFLSDAIEGYQSASFATSYAHLNEIAASFAAEKQPGKVIVMPVKRNNWAKKLAVAVIITGAGFITWMLINNNQQKQNVVAKINMPLVTTPAPADTLKAVTSPPLALNQVKIGPADKATEYKSNVTTQQNFTVANDANVTSTELTNKTDTSFYFPPANSVASANSKFNMGANKADFYKKDSLFDDKAAFAYSNSYANNAPMLNTRSAKGPSLANNNLMSNKQQEGFLAAADSTAIAANSPALKKPAPADKLMEVTAANGRAAPPTMQRKASGLVVTLTPQPGFDSIPVTYLNNKNATHRIVADSTLFPQGGWESFRDYVSKKLHNKIDTSAGVIISGDVELEFVVDDSGNARNIKVTRSLDDERDAEALELVRKWPGWVAGKKHGKTKLVIQF